jgi:hypothetical protein
MIDTTPSLEGVLVGWPVRNAGHYVLENAFMVAGEGGKVSLEGRQYVPKERILFAQELSS